jgi:hypothetical protein
MPGIADYEYRWATDGRAHSMPHVEELTYLGYEPVIRAGEIARDPRYPHSVLMRRLCA